MGDMIQDLPPAASSSSSSSPSSSSPATRRNQLFLGTFVHSKTREALEYLHDAAVCVDTSGTIVAVETGYDLARAEAELLPRLGWEMGHVEVNVARDGQFFFPGFIGTLLMLSFLFSRPCWSSVSSRGRPGPGECRHGGVDMEHNKHEAPSPRDIATPS